MVRDIARSSWHRGHRGATGDRRASSRRLRSGGVAEWLKAPVLKTGRGESLSRVRIPPPPPITTGKPLTCRIIYAVLSGSPHRVPHPPTLFRDPSSALNGEQA